MTFIGDIERLVATNLYPLRIPIAIGMALGIIGLVVLARRRGWFAAARRHPARTSTVIVLALAIGLPVGWYLGSPLFIRTSLVEPAPVAVVPSQAGQPGESARPEAPLPSATLGTPPDASAQAPLGTPRSGTFKGADDFHFAQGTALLVQTGADSWVVRFEDFSVRNGPSLHVYLSPDTKGFVDGAVDLGPLKATDGSFNTRVPAGTDVDGANSVVIWCKEFAVQFGVARLR